MMHRVKEMLDACAHPYYVARGRRPWSLGYYTAKKRTIENAIDGGLLRNGKPLPPGYGARLDERVVEYPWVYARLSSHPGAVLDAGSALNHLFLLERPPVSSAELTICTLSPEKRCYARKGISYVYDDLRHSRFAPQSFDTIISISTIEHIGLDNAMLYTDDASKAESDQSGYRAAVREFRRLIRPNRDCFITVPYGRAANHRWFQVFDARMIENILADFNPSASEIEYFGYSPDGWRCVRAEDLSEATFFDIHERKEYDADFAAGARGVACMRLTA